MNVRTSKSRKHAKAKADKYFSEYIRKRDENEPCITCGAYKSDKDCGHFISRRFEATRLDETNAHGQCLKCNRFQNGNQYQHGQAIDRKYGKGTAEKLLLKSKMPCRRKQFDYEALADYYKSKIKEL